MHLPSVNGPEQESSYFSQIWAEKTGCELTLNMHSRVYELLEVIIPPQPQGNMRLARPEEAEIDWQMLNAMQAEAVLSPVTDVGLERVHRMIVESAIYVWEAEGQIASMAMKIRPTETACTISGVYTWPDKRGKGYASALVAGLAQVILDEGKRMATLFTNLANPISNSIYQKIGFRPVCDYQQYDFVN